MPKVTQEYRDARRAEILDAALRCFAERGFQRTSIADIIAESGLSAGAIYGHYTSKQEIAIAAARRVLTHRMSELATLAEAEDIPAPGEVLGIMLRGITKDFRDTKLLVQIWGEAVTDAELDTLAVTAITELGESFSRYFTVWAVRSTGMSPAEAEEWASRSLPVMLGLGQGYILQGALLPEFDREGYLKSVREILPH